MKILLLSFILLNSLTLFAATYSGVDDFGRYCYVEISDVDDDQIFLKVSTSLVTTSLYAEPFEGSMKLQKKTTQGNDEITLRTTDSIFVESKNGILTRVTLKRGREVKDNDWFSFYEDTEEYGGTQEVKCNIHYQ